MSRRRETVGEITFMGPEWKQQQCNITFAFHRPRRVPMNQSSTTSGLVFVPVWVLLSRRRLTTQVLCQAEKSSRGSGRASSTSRVVVPSLVQRVRQWWQELVPSEQGGKGKKQNSSKSKKRTNRGGHGKNRDGTRRKQRGAGRSAQLSLDRNPWALRHNLGERKNEILALSSLLIAACVSIVLWITFGRRRQRRHLREAYRGPGSHLSADNVDEFRSIRRGQTQNLSFQPVASLVATRVSSAWSRKSREEQGAGDDRTFANDTICEELDRSGQALENTAEERARQKENLEREVLIRAMTDGLPDLSVVETLEFVKRWRRAVGLTMEESIHCAQVGARHISEQRELPQRREELLGRLGLGILVILNSPGPDEEFLGVMRDAALSRVGATAGISSTGMEALVKQESQRAYRHELERWMLNLEAAQATHSNARRIRNLLGLSSAAAVVILADELRRMLKERLFASGRKFEKLEQVKSTLEIVRLAESLVPEEDLLEKHLIGCVRELGMEGRLLLENYARKFCGEVRLQMSSKPQRRSIKLNRSFLGSDDRSSNLSH